MVSRGSWEPDSAPSHSCWDIEQLLQTELVKGSVQFQGKVVKDLSISLLDGLTSPTKGQLLGSCPHRARIFTFEQVVKVVLNRLLSISTI